ncbi:Crp/Fnr family transcriptional regulator [uncultured Oscillibacter sp.]|uniref:Crp/Fnr family transcriptional regulator n=1 Tax=uncultured Oscillibacter sp. TaxID=876091 RepID=UPI0025CC677E|nr:Crp/Fnr family transcriptional regulator [uncultured Oscillibacter sp.]
MLTQQELEKSPLFRDISYEEYRRMLTCFQAVQKSYRPEELVYDFAGPNKNAVGILERGEAALIRIDEDGVATVLEELTCGGVFGRDLAFAGARGDSLEVVCRTACDVLFIDYPHILKRCENACTHHSLLVQNMLQLIADKAQSLSERVDVLSRRSIREKLLCYFRQQAEKAGGDTFTLPFSLSTLADYIATDRSAMMRELKRLREEALIRSDGRQFTLLA